MQPAHAKWVCHLGYSHFVTLNFNRDTTPGGARTKFKDLLARMDWSWLGKRWAARPSDDRTFAIAFMENIATNLHLHAGFRGPPCPRPRTIPTLPGLIDMHWRKLVPGGSTHISPIYDVEGFAGYITKQLVRPGSIERMLISTEFHPH